MKLSEIIEELELEVKSAAEKLDREVTAAYVSDLLSDVIAHAKTGGIWITLQLHENVVAVAAMRELAAVIIINGRQPEEATIARAVAEGIPLLVSSMPAFELAGRLYELGIRGTP